MRLKPGVRVLGIRPELVLVLVAAEPLFSKKGVDLVLTSVIDGKHSRGSLHYAGAAVDLRSRELTSEEKEEIKVQLALALGADYDVVLERNHFHIEFQPKAPY